MIKAKSVYVCQNCGKQHPRWSGQCDACGEWQSLVEEAVPTKTKSGSRKMALASQVVTLDQVSFEETQARLSTCISELDRVLGGVVERGIVPGSVILLGGHPGVGKSTLLTQVVLEILMKPGHELGTILYVSGEENPTQISLRINRLLGLEQQKKVTSKASQAWKSRLIFATSTDVDQVATLIMEKKPLLVIIDSIQTMTTDELTGSAGSIGQIRSSAERLIGVAKQQRIPMFVVGHVTKEGQLAGPKVLEHMVDVVLELSGESTTDLRLLRSIKNRFGATDEVGVFKMVESGFISLVNPSELFLTEHLQPAIGSATTCVVEGTRPLVVEVQALVNKSYLPTPRRVGRGIDTARIQVLAAVLEKHCRLPFGSQDIFANLAGGFKTKEPAIDLSLAIALVSSLKNMPAPKESVFLGEVGLLGEIRSVRLLDRRIKEAGRLGYTKQYHAKSHRNLQGLLQELKLI
ncbi:MAG: DNA repair protein RadA [Patescibacteria group bacterium]|nr:DNA repair protein RadA [Patescibacteria group bacterium]